MDCFSKIGIFPIFALAFFLGFGFLVWKGYRIHKKEQKEIAHRLKRQREREERKKEQEKIFAIRADRFINTRSSDAWDHETRVTTLSKRSTSRKHKELEDSITDAVDAARDVWYNKPDKYKDEYQEPYYSKSHLDSVTNHNQSTSHYSPSYDHSPSYGHSSSSSCSDSGSSDSGSSCSGGDD